MVFPVKTLRDFLLRAKGIKTNTIIPVLSYIKFDGEYLIKTNQETFYRSKAEVKDPTPVLLDEQKLSSFLSPSNIGEAEEILIEIGEKTVTLSLIDGKKPLRFEKSDILVYPRFPEIEGDTGTLDAPVINMIYAARNLVSQQTEVLNNFCFIHLAEGGIYASNFNSFFYYETFHNAGNILLSREAAGVIGGFENLSYSRAGNYDFFTTETEAFAFIKPVQKTPLQQFRQVIDGGTKEEWFEVSKSDLAAFCELVNQVCPSLQMANPVTFPDCTLSVKEKTMSLILKDDQYSIDVTHEYEVLGQWQVDPFHFNPKLFLTYLKSLPFQTIRFSPYSRPGFFTVWTVEDEAFNGILTQLAVA